MQIGDLFLFDGLYGGFHWALFDEAKVQPFFIFVVSSLCHFSMMAEWFLMLMWNIWFKSMAQNKEKGGFASIGGTYLKKWLDLPAGLLLVLWGWAQFLNYLRFFLVRVISMSFLTCKMLEYLTNGLLLLVLLFTILYVYEHRSWFKNRNVKTLLVAWVSLIISMVFTNLIQQNVLGHIVFELQHALFMLLTALVILITANLIENRWMFVGGILFALLALGASFFALKTQMLLEAIGWFLCFVIPGHLYLRVR